MVQTALFPTALELPGLPPAAEKSIAANQKMAAIATERAKDALVTALLDYCKAGGREDLLTHTATVKTVFEVETGVTGLLKELKFGQLAPYDVISTLEQAATEVGVAAKRLAENRSAGLTHQISPVDLRYVLVEAVRSGLIDKAGISLIDIEILPNLMPNSK